ncbi:patatin-like phospholipase family protein [Enterovibrio coralii]|uniref:patatin-like phospholipase family protein n=1 Tax=Enterovibrio coralii TaxID=294935 RepID=UPI000B0AD099|nr:patatin-like phospholipase family protein [Enterovibrio coralii]
MRLGEIAQGKHVLVVAYEIARRKPVVFKTTKPSHKNLKSADIADATSAAPTYFPTVKMKLDGLDAWLVDGGVVANNPTMCAISEALSAWETTIDKVKVLSVGTGYRTRKINGPASRDWGAVQWFLQGSLIDLLSDERIVEHQSATILPPANYLRVNSELSRAVIDPAPDDAMDDIDADNIRKLVKLGDIWFEEYGDDAIKLLLS